MSAKAKIFFFPIRLDKTLYLMLTIQPSRYFFQQTDKRVTNATVNARVHKTVNISSV